MKRLLLFLVAVLAFLLAVAFRFMEVRKADRKPPLAISPKRFSAIDCRVTPWEEGPGLEIMPLTGWGNYRWKITTGSDSAQYYFNQGINMYYAFHTLESRASFVKAIRFDSTCAMAWYGKALALGPTINYGNGFRAVEAAVEAALQSRKFSSSCTDMEKGLIGAILQRYSADTGFDLKALQKNYSAAMGQLSHEFPQNADVLTLYADALMLEHPWDLYDSALRPKPWTPHIRRVLEQALALAPLHPGANHFMVHTLEGSLHPEEALKNAETLADLMPDVAHIVHMPSHIYIRTGNYLKGIQANDRAVRGYMKYIRQYQPAVQDAPLYQFHAAHLKFDCALHAGNYVISSSVADTLRQFVTPGYLSVPGPAGSFYQYMYESGLFAEIRFGKWDSILREPVLDSLPYAAVLGHFGRGMALCRRNRLPEAEKEIRLVQHFMQAKTLREPFDPMSSAYDACLIADNILEGTVSEEGHDPARALEFFEKAVTAEDHLIYDEPRDWLLPARQYLGDLYLKLGEFRQAIRVFKEDLIINPKNGWSLTGLQIAFKALHDGQALKAVNQELAIAWQIKDYPVSRPVF